MKKFIKRICRCSCNKEYYGFIKEPEPSKWEITSYLNGDNKYPLEITRLSDNQKFRLGDNIQRITPRGKKYSKCILYKIQVEDGGFMQLHCYTIGGTNGTACIRNEKMNYSSADDPNLFNYIINITVKR